MNRFISRVVVIALAVFILTQNTWAGEEKSRKTAFFLSLAAPGLGQWYAGSPGSGRLFIASELMSLGGFYYMTLLKQSYGDDYLRFAAVHAGVDPTGYGSEYLTLLGAYDSSFDYAGSQEQKSDSPLNYEGPQAWNWDSYRNRDHFKQIRESELNFENYSKYCMAGLILNHLLAGLNASQLAGRQSAVISGVSVHPTLTGLQASYSWRF